ncbi:MAG TPA: arginine--tRNA ligase [Saprospiraceae bacterium]|nr:arginine--tRNA ligase [Saprospiraceae bacterium]
MRPISDVNNLIVTAVEAIYRHQVDPQSLVINQTRPEYDGQYTVVTFPLAKQLKKNPEDVGKAIGEKLVAQGSIVSSFQVVKGFLNLSLTDVYWQQVLEYMEAHPDAWKSPPRHEKVLVEFSSPNTNKPLHLGHIRNILLGWATSKILAANGFDVVRVQIINDRGIAICKSMLAWQKYAGGQTPESTGIKPDHFVGDWYVRFEEEFQKEYKSWQLSAPGVLKYEERAKGRDEATFFSEYKNTYFNEDSILGREAREMLKQWEAGDPDTIALWKRMNNWVYEGFEKTYAHLGISFDKLYYESETWQLGKEMVMEGLKKGLFYQKEDGSLWVDLEDQGLDHKILLRSDGTSVYITQDLGTAHLRYKEFGARRMVYVVADEQDYHFQALFGTLKKLKEPYADGLHHLSYGMVDLPSGKMKSREGTVVDADDLLETVKAEAHKAAADRGEITGMTEDEQNEVIRKISLAALKFFILRVDPHKRMLFDPAESVDLQGQTGPYIQNAYVRIRSILARTDGMDIPSDGYMLKEDEKRLISVVAALPDILNEAAAQYSPSTVAQYCYNLAKSFHRYYHEYRVLNAETDQARAFRIKLVTQVAHVLHEAMELLGIEMPEKM